jgi:hypothetical protein
MLLREFSCNGLRYKSNVIISTSLNRAIVHLSWGTPVGRMSLLHPPDTLEFLPNQTRARKQVAN